MTTYKTNLLTTYNQHAEERNQEQEIPKIWKVEDRAKFFAQLQKAGKKTLLELGAGTGHDGRFFADAGLEVTCTDLSPEMVKLCQAKGLKAQVMDLLDLTFPAASFDAIWASNCLLHLPHQDLLQALQSIQHILKPEGLFHLRVYGGSRFEGVWEKDDYWPKRFYNFYPDAEIEAMMRTYFEILNFKTLDTGEEKIHAQIFMLTKN